MRLIFIHSDNSETTVDDYVTIEDAISKINIFLKEEYPKYKSPYVRFWNTTRGIMYDVGSHSEFFLLEGAKIDSD